MVVPRWLGVVVLLVVVFLWSVAVYLASPNAQTIIGFCATGVGGLLVVWGEVAGPAFGSRPSGGQAAAAVRAFGFLVLTLATLLLAVPQVGLAENSEELRQRYLIATGVLFATALVGTLIAFHVGRQAAEKDANEH